MIHACIRRIQLFFIGNRFGVSLSSYANSEHYFLDSLENGLKYGNLIITPEEALNAQRYISGLKLDTYHNSPLNFKIEENFRTLLQLIILKKQPKLLVETGVANGVSTQIILIGSKMYNGFLHSFDIDPMTEEVGRKYLNWKFHVLNKSKAWKDLLNKINRIGAVDMWIHDSDHSFYWQYSEYNLAWKILRPGGVLLSDDIDTSEAWFKFCQKNKLKSCVILDNRKLIGFVVKNAF